MLNLVAFGKKGYGLSDFINNIPSQIYTSVIIVIFLCIFTSIIGFKAKRSDPLKKPGLLVFLGIALVENVEKFVIGNMGEKLKYYTPYFCVIALYLPMAFLSTLLGFQAPITHISFPLSLALITFVLIHFTAIKYQGFKHYLDRYKEPVIFFMPINILSTPIIIVSLTCRLLGNGLAGLIIMELIYWATSLLSGLLFTHFNFTALLIAPLLHAFLDIFVCFIQTFVFIFLSTLFIAKEVPDEQAA